MKADLGSGAALNESDSNQSAITSRQLAEIEALEKDVKVRLRKKLLTESQVEQLQALQFPTLVELKQIIN